MQFTKDDVECLYANLRLNENIINDNVKFLMNYYRKFFELYKKDVTIQNFDEHFYSEINDKIRFFNENKTIKTFIDNEKNNVTKLKLNNITFYCYGNELEKSKLLLKIANVMYQFYEQNKEITIIWIPINKRKIFQSSFLNEDTLQQSVDNFEAFTVSGLTQDNHSTVIITRQEEIIKLLFHELIHCFDADGSNYNFDEIIKEYRKKKDSRLHSYESDIFESYTELLSSYFNMIYYLVSENVLLTDEVLFNRLKSLILIEYFYSLNLICNLIHLNSGLDYDFFYQYGYFIGDICIYEYYYLKTIMYNNFKLKELKTKNDFSQNLKNIINLNTYDPNIARVFQYYKKTNLYNYCFVHPNLPHNFINV